MVPIRSTAGYTPRGIKNEFSRIVGSVIVAGSLPPPLTRPSAVHVLPPRLGGSYIILPVAVKFPIDLVQVDRFENIEV